MGDWRDESVSDRKAMKYQTPIEQPNNVLEPSSTPVALTLPGSPAQNKQ
jgi:hypothetical protein